MEDTLAVHQEKPRIKILDSLRGFTALSVVLCHLTAGVYQSSFVELSPFNILVNAHGAVIFFFVLSGYVLTYQYQNDPNYKFDRFLLLRFIRLYIPYVASVGLALILKFFCNHTNSQFRLSTFWTKPISFTDLINHLTLVTNFDTTKLNGVIWSLIHEMRMAFLFPLMLFITRLKIWKAIIITLIIYLLAVILNEVRFNPSVGYHSSYISTFIFFYIFILGGLIAAYQYKIIAWYSRLSQPQKWMFVTIGVMFYCYAAFIPKAAAKLGLSKVIVDYLYHYAVDLTITVASAIFLIAAISANPGSFFTGKVPLFLGKISYSLYLVHIPVGVFMVHTFADKLPVLAILVLALTSSFLVAIVFNIFIERPAMKLGKKLLSQ